MSKRTLHDFWFKKEPSKVPITNTITNITSKTITDSTAGK